MFEKAKQGLWGRWRRLVCVGMVLMGGGYGFSQLYVYGESDPGPRLSPYYQELHDSIATAGELYRQIYGEKFITHYKDLSVEGQSDVKPKSGHWYPLSEGGLNSTNVLNKYDIAFNNGVGMASSWEAKHRVSRVVWHGHCNGYAAAALRHREPKNSVLVGEVEFTPKDIKALLAGIYMGVRYRILGGKRCDYSLSQSLPYEKRQACDDINPALFHLLVSNWVGTQKQAIIFDREANEQVWNFPLYGFHSLSTLVTQGQAEKLLGYYAGHYSPHPHARRFLHVETTVFYADAVNEEEVLDHTEEALENYKYILELDHDGYVLSGQWGPQSRTAHPDFLWVPLRTLYKGVERERANPHLDIDTVLQLWATSLGLDSPDDEPSPYDLFDFESDWGKFSFYRVIMGDIKAGERDLKPGTFLKSGSEFAFLSSTLNLRMQGHVTFNDSNRPLSIILDDQRFARPYFQHNQDVQVLLPGGEPGISRYRFEWGGNRATGVKGFTHTLGIYTME